MRIQTRRQQIQELRAENLRLVKVQELVIDNMLAVQEKDTTYTGNRYQTYSEAVLELAKKYAGQADWGVIQVGSIIDLRAAYIAGQGIKVSKVKFDDEEQAKASKDAIDAAYAFAQRFIDKNELDHELVQDLAREAEIEGKTLIKLFPLESEDEASIDGIDIALRWISWTTNKYKVTVNAEDYLQLERVEWDPVNGTHQKLLPPGCVYKKFAGRLDVPGDTMPRTAKCLTQIENLDMALKDWREINRLYAAPVPDLECADAEVAKAGQAALDKANWKIGKAFSHVGVFDFKQPSAEGQKAIESEIITLMKLISGTTGVPIHFLGAPELTTKYGAANEGLLELIAMSTSKEREIWRAAYQELLEKAMRLWNETTKKTPLRPELVKIELPLVTQEQWERITSTWLMLYQSDAITRKTLLEQVPGIDADKEIEALKIEQEEAMDRFAEQEVNVEDEDENADPNADEPRNGGNGSGQFGSARNRMNQRRGARA